MGWLGPILLVGTIVRWHSAMRKDLRNARLWACTEIKNNRQLRNELADAHEMNDLLMQRCRELVVENRTFRNQLRGQP